MQAFWPKVLRETTKAPIIRIGFWVYYTLFVRRTPPKEKKVWVIIKAPILLLEGVVWACGRNIETIITEQKLARLLYDSWSNIGDLCTDVCMYVCCIDMHMYLCAGVCICAYLRPSLNCISRIASAHLFSLDRGGCAKSGEGRDFAGSILAAP